MQMAMVYAQLSTNEQLAVGATCIERPVAGRAMVALASPPNAGKSSVWSAAEPDADRREGPLSATRIVSARLAYLALFG